MGLPVNKYITLCADDFAQSEAISQGIVTLLDAGRLSAVSCMTDSPRWNQDALTLTPYAAQADIGLHFNLTHSFGQPVKSLRELMQSSLFRTIDLAPVRKSLQHQLDRFEDSMHRAPDFVDGHQHVHVFPRIRQVVSEILGRRYPARKPYLRRVSPAIWNHDAPAKAMVLRLLARNAGDDAASAGFRLPAAFAGLYSLSPAADFGRYMRKWLASVPSGTLIMCHPALASNATEDLIAAARWSEMTYLLSDAFSRDLLAVGIKLSRFE
jgi:predicted glycoside hydrolase/deacetylase ChbG (UPF0249 family)